MKKEIKVQVEAAVASEVDQYMVQTETVFREISKEFLSGKRDSFEISEKDNLDIFNATEGDTEMYQMDGGQYAHAVASNWEEKFKEWNAAL